MSSVDLVKTYLNGDYLNGDTPCVTRLKGFDCLQESKFKKTWIGVCSKGLSKEMALSPEAQVS